jgi:hypothetical protein
MKSGADPPPAESADAHNPAVTVGDPGRRLPRVLTSGPDAMQGYRGWIGHRLAMGFNSGGSSSPDGMQWNPGRVSGHYPGFRVASAGLHRLFSLVRSSDMHGAWARCRAVRATGALPPAGSNALTALAAAIGLSSRLRMSAQGCVRAKRGARRPGWASVAAWSMRDIRTLVPVVTARFRIHRE